MTHRSIRQLVTVDPQPGSGILRPFPTAELADLDPFVFLDTGRPMQLGDNDIYVGPHPHRGVQPVGLLFRGRIEHRDSLGNHRTITSGGMQWLVAGSGALHEEILQGDESGVFHMAQLWVNVPGAHKMNPPEHHAIDAEEVPLVNLAPGVALRLHAGEVADHKGPAPLSVPVTVGHLRLDPGSSIALDVPRAWTAAYTVVADQIDGPDGPLEPGATVVHHHDGDTVLISSTHGGEVLLMFGEPIGEPIVMGGGFVMNTRAEIDHAFADLAAGQMGALTPSR